MMREEVCIVLNEREPAKARAAETLQAKLRELNITASRPKIDGHIQALLHNRSPRVLVLDYLIGDYTTGLDIMASFAAKEPRPQIVFLTDEPSIPVAVEAMRSGAIDYLELDHPRAIHNAACSVAEALKRHPAPPPAAAKARLGLDELVANSRAGVNMLEQARALALKPVPLMLLHGRRGAGATALAQAIAAQKLKHGYCTTLDLRIFDEELASFFGLDGKCARGLTLGKDLALIIDRLEEDEGGLLQLLARHLPRIRDGGAGDPRRSFIIACTDCAATAAAWRDLAGAEVLAIPSLELRREDIPALTRRFLCEAEEFLGKAIKAFDPDVMTWLCGLDWPEEIKQLRAVVIESAVRATFSREKIMDLIETARELWRLQSAAPPGEARLDAYAAAAALEACGHNYRIAAARLGCTAAQLRGVLRTPRREEARPAPALVEDGGAA
jgi:two-component system, NtrC family, nitrogen regulation response regulator GlnG